MAAPRVYWNQPCFMFHRFPDHFKVAISQINGIDESATREPAAMPELVQACSLELRFCHG